MDTLDAFHGGLSQLRREARRTPPLSPFESGSGHSADRLENERLSFV